ncbi:hypothetical protein ACFSQQ_14705 [Mesorhizobium kowhaii]|uniref:hypothetical protein n=1 Tax=Mesorhizobium kowhaii TaxID=1300272 RepID=UPI0035E8D8A4
MMPLALKSFPDDPARVPNIYGVRGAGDCMEPLIPEGSDHCFTKLQVPQAGDVVAVWFAPHVFTSGGHVRCKLLVASDAQTVDLVMLNPFTRVRFQRVDILAMHKCFAISEPNGQAHWMHERLQGLTLHRRTTNVLSS